MQDIIHYNHCPVCGSPDFKEVLKVKDHSVSKEIFAIAECAACSLRFTQDVPGQNNISRYYHAEEYISHTNTSKGLINRLYHAVRKRTLTTKRKLVIKGTGIEKGRLLDLGSGTGSFVHEMSQNGWEVEGLEPDEIARANSKKMYGLELKDITALSEFQASSFDAISLWHVLEHVHDLHDTIELLKNLLTENGRIFIAVPNYTAGEAGVYGEYWAAFDVPRHLYHFSPRSLKVLIEKHGLSLLECRPMWYDSFYISMLSSKYKNGHTNYPAAFINGLRSNMSAAGDPSRSSSVIYILGK